MASIVSENASITFPFVGSDSRFIKRMKNGLIQKNIKVGGDIVTESKGSNGVRAIESLNISLKNGDRLGISGHNGAGKTTLLRLLAGIYPPTSGRIHIDGKVAGLFSLGLGINKELSGYDNIKIKGMMFGLHRREIMPLIPEIVEFSGLGDYIHMPVKSYSSGMSLRLQFAIATSLKADILLMDEWVTTADQSFASKVDLRLEQMIDEAPIVVIASHNEKRLAEWASRVINLENGRITSDTDTSDVKVTVSFKPDPKMATAYRRLFNFGEMEKALEMIEDVWPVAKAPKDHYFQLARYHSKQNSYENALQAYDALIEIAPENPSYHDQMGSLHMRDGNPAKAEAHILTALRLSKGMVGNTNLLKKSITAQGRDEVEVKTFLESFN